MRWPLQRPQEPAARLPHARPMPPAPAATADDDVGALLLPGFMCTTCGREDLPPAGDWDPPICLECDAAINFDAELEAHATDDNDDDEPF